MVILRASLSTDAWLQTHNIALTRPVAKFVISLDTSGTIIKQSAPSEVLERDSSFAEEVHHETEALELDKHEDELLGASKDAKGGQLVIAEEIAVGRVSWQAGRCSLCHLKGAYT